LIDRASQVVRRHRAPGEVVRDVNRSSDGHVMFSQRHPDGAETMPRFFFDLFHDRYVVLDPAGMSFEHAAGATAAADELARDLLVTRSELRNSGSWIRVRDDGATELYRAAIDPTSPAPVLTPAPVSMSDGAIRHLRQPPMRESPAATAAE
jgi:hypothetical protein